MSRRQIRGVTRLDVRGCRKRVAVTGVGIISPIGNGSEGFWRALCERATGPTQTAECVREEQGPRTAGRIAQLALSAAQFAFEDARRPDLEGEAAEAGIFLGANLDDVNLVGLCRSFRTAGGSLTKDPDWREFARRAREHLHPFDYLRALSNMPAAHLAIRYGARGACCSYVAHGISGAEAIGDAYVAVREGRLAWALAGGADTWLTPWGVWRRGILGGSGQTRCRPFGNQRSGPRLGEGAAVIVLEPLETARARRARVYAELAGYATSLDASVFPAPARGAGLARCIRAALADARIDARDVDYVSAHGEGSMAGDRLEAWALRQVFGAALPPLGCVKARTGHLGAASGAVEAAATAMAMERQHLPEGARPDEIDPDLDLPAPRPRVSSAQVEWALNVAHHVLGLSAALVFRRARADGDSLPSGS